MSGKQSRLSGMRKADQSAELSSQFHCSRVVPLLSGEQSLAVLFRARPALTLSRSDAALTFLVFAAGLIFIFPLLGPVILGLFALVGGVWLVRVSGHGLDSLPQDPLLLMLAGFGLYCVFSALWALDPAAAASKGTITLLFALSTVVVASSINVLPDRLVPPFAVAVTIAVGVAALVGVIQASFGMVIVKWLFSLFPGLTPAKLKGLVVEEGAIAFVEPFVRNRAQAVLGFVFWPVLLLISGYRSLAQRVVLPACIGGGIIYTLLAGANNSVQLGLGLGAGGFLLSFYWPSVARWAFLAAWTAAVLLVVPASYLAFEAGLHKSQWIPERSGQARLYIWRYTAEQVREHPILGIGVRSTRVLEKAKREAEGRDPSLRYERRLGWHAHNLYLQTWLELGAVGAAFLLALGALLLERIRRLEERCRPYAYATFATISGAVAVGWGMWQSWLWASVGLAISALLLGCRFATEQPASPAADK